MTITQKLSTFYLLALAAFALLALLLYRAMPPERRVEFQISLLIQLLGTVALGAVVTYSLYAIEHSQQAQEKEQQDARIASENKTRVLGFIKSELSYDLSSLKVRDGSIPSIEAHPLKSDYWRISGLSGELRWVDAPELLNLIAQAYFEIENNAAWETRYVEASIGAGSALILTLGNGQQLKPQAFIYGMLKQSYASAIVSIDAALKGL
jgi:hypothetical protein